MTNNEQRQPIEQGNKTDNTIEKPYETKESSEYQQIRKTYDHSASMEVNNQFMSLLLIVVTLFTELTIFKGLIDHYHPHFPLDVLINQILTLLLLVTITIIAIYQFRILFNWRTQLIKSNSTITKGYITLFDKINRITISGLLIILCNIGLIPLLLMFNMVPPPDNPPEINPIARLIPVISICFIYPVFEVLLVIHWIRKTHHIGKIESKFSEEHLFDNLDENEPEKEELKK